MVLSALLKSCEYENNIVEADTKYRAFQICWQMILLASAKKTPDITNSLPFYTDDLSSSGFKWLQIAAHEVLWHTELPGCIVYTGQSSWLAVNAGVPNFCGARAMRLLRAVTLVKIQNKKCLFTCGFFVTSDLGLTFGLQLCLAKNIQSCSYSIQ